jgi:hypothetical protein
VAAAYETGASTTELCKCYGLSKGGVLKLLRDAGVEMRWQPMTETEIAMGLKQREQGCSYDEIGRRLGKAQTTVWRVLREQG